MKLKQHLAKWLQRLPPLRWGLALVVRVWMPSHYVGAVGVVFNDQGRLLLVEHVFRPYHPWGLPGGWVERGEDPADTVRRELKEELSLTVEVKRLLLCQPQGVKGLRGVPPGLGLAFYCRPILKDAAPLPKKAYEILSTAWVDPEHTRLELTPLDQTAIYLARKEFEREQKGSRKTENYPD